MTNPQTIFALHEGFGEKFARNITDLAEEIRAGTITAGVFHVPCIDYATADLRWLGQFSGKEEHQSICGAAALWMTERGWEWSAKPKDLGYPGGIADVVALAERIAVEAGYTRASKVLEACGAGWRVIVVPYVEDEPEGHPAFVFTGVAPLITPAKYEQGLREAADSIYVPAVLNLKPRARKGTP